jgi:hypothetical protein
MARSPKNAKNGVQEIETRPDGWERFERAVDAAVKSGPKHRATKLKTAKKGQPRKPARTVKPGQ